MVKIIVLLWIISQGEKELENRENKLKFERIHIGAGYSGKFIYTGMDYIPWLPFFPGTSGGREPGIPYYFLNSPKIDLLLYHPDKSFWEIGVEYAYFNFKNKNFLPRLKGDPGNYLYKYLSFNLHAVPVYINLGWEFKRYMFFKFGVISFIVWGKEIREVDADNEIWTEEIKGSGKSFWTQIEFGRGYSFTFLNKEWKLSISFGVRGCSPNGIEYDSPRYIGEANIDLSGIYFNIEVENILLSKIYKEGRK